MTSDWLNSDAVRRHMVDPADEEAAMELIAKTNRRIWVDLTKNGVERISERDYRIPFQVTK